MKILIIDDEPNVLENIKEILENDNYQVITAYNAANAILLAEKKLPDLIICDINLPDENGYFILESLKQNPMTFDIPFVFLSAKVDKSDIRSGMNLGADDYITKPFKPNELLNVIKIRLNKVKNIKDKVDEKIHEVTMNIATTLPHELQTPLCGVLSSTEILMDKFKEHPDFEARQLLENIYNSGKRLESTISKYLKYVETELIKNDIEKTQSLRKEILHNPALLIHNISDVIASKYNRKDDLVLFLLNTDIFIDEYSFSIIIDEILDNSFKFSESSTVEIRAKIDNDLFVLDIIDYGYGMTAQQIKELNSFQQFNRNYLEQQGSGMGLAIVKNLCEIFKIEWSINSSVDIFTRVNLKFKIYNPKYID